MTLRPAHAVIDAGALRRNWKAVRARSSAKKIIAVVKANAYGHGLTTAADALADFADAFAVSEICDAQTLRARGTEKPILLICGAFCPGDIAEIARLRLWTVVHNWRQVEWLKAAPASANITVFLKLDCGMNRLGFRAEEWGAAKTALAANPAIGDIVLMSHFARADEPDGLQNALATIAPLRELCAQTSLGNSAGTLLHGDIGDDWARVGIALYGSSPAPQWRSRGELGLSAVMTLSAQLGAIRTVRAGECVGYGCEWRAQKDTRAGLVRCGYADGYPRLAGGAQARATVGGMRAPIVGRVSMEWTALDLSHIPDAALDDAVLMWGDSPGVDEIAAAAGRISYELLTAAG